MYVKKIKRKCGVRGCKNTGAFAISKTREAGNSVIICESCLNAAANEVKNYSDTQEKSDKKTGVVPSLFFNAVALGITAADKGPDKEPEDNGEVILDGVPEEAEEPEDNGEVILDGVPEEAEEPEGWQCEICERSFASERALKAHMRSHEKAGS